MVARPSIFGGGLNAFEPRSGMGRRHSSTGTGCLRTPNPSSLVNIQRLVNKLIERSTEFAVGVTSKKEELKAPLDSSTFPKGSQTFVLYTTPQSVVSMPPSGLLTFFSQPLIPFSEMQMRKPSLETSIWERYF